MNKATVLTVDDDESLQTVMRQYLEQQGCQFISALSGAELLSKLQTSNPDIILLDLGLPDHDGLSLLNIIRGKSKAPIIVISGRTETADRIVGLEMGADDYLIKPFEMRELLAHIKAVLRRFENQAAATPKETAVSLAHARRIYFNGWVLDRTQYQLFDSNGRSAELTSGEFRLLEALIGSPNRVLSREHLFDHTRQGKFDAYDRVIDIQIARIRKKLDGDSATPSLIKTIRGVGYMFCGEVKPYE